MDIIFSRQLAEPLPGHTAMTAAITAKQHISTSKTDPRHHCVTHNLPANKIQAARLGEHLKPNSWKTQLWSAKNIIHIQFQEFLPNFNIRCSFQNSSQNFYFLICGDVVKLC